MTSAAKNYLQSMTFMMPSIQKKKTDGKAKNTKGNGKMSALHAKAEGSMSKKENSIQSEILDFLRGNKKKGIQPLGGYWLNFHGGSPYMPRGIPDIIGCYRGRFVALEVKRPGEKPSVIQGVTLRALKRAGAITAIVHSLDETKEVLMK